MSLTLLFAVLAFGAMSLLGASPSGADQPPGSCSVSINQQSGQATVTWRSVPGVSQYRIRSNGQEFIPTTGTSDKINVFNGVTHFSVASFNIFTGSYRYCGFVNRRILPPTNCKVSKKPYPGLSWSGNELTNHRVYRNGRRFFDVQGPLSFSHDVTAKAGRTYHYSVIPIRDNGTEIGSRRTYCGSVVATPFTWCSVRLSGNNAILNESSFVVGHVFRNGRVIGGNKGAVFLQDRDLPAGRTFHYSLAPDALPAGSPDSDPTVQIGPRGYCGKVVT